MISQFLAIKRKELRSQLEQLNIQNQGLKKKLEEASFSHETPDNSSIMYEVLFLRKQVQDLNSTITKLKGDLMNSIAEVSVLKYMLNIILELPTQDHFDYNSIFTGTS
jgi:predicted RNase H-like nuclease (RuvC/YqgF family)